MESRKVAGGHGRLTTCVDPRQIQKLNKQASVLFGDDHLFEPNFSAPMPFPEKYDDPVEEELLGVEYAYCQSTDFTAKEYYIEKGLLQDWQTVKMSNSNAKNSFVTRQQYGKCKRVFNC